MGDGILPVCQEVGGGLDRGDIGRPMRIKFVGRNEYGVLDHYVYPRPGLEILNPMRVIPNGSGSEIIFTLFQWPDMSDEKFAEDVTLVERDLKTLKGFLEG